MNFLDNFLMPKTEKTKKQKNSKDHQLSNCIGHIADDYLHSMKDFFPGDMHQVVMNEVEKSLLRRVMIFTRQNQSSASQILGISRTTLRKKLQQNNLE